MSDDRHDSRAKRHEKKQSQKKKIIFFTGLGAVFCIILFSLIAFGTKDKQEAEEPEKSQAELALENQEESFEITAYSEQDDEEEKKEEEEEKDKKKKDEEPDVEEVEVDDSNVLKAYEADWEPLGTSQTGEHTTNYDDGSSDREEIRQAVSDVTGIDQQNMTEHWVGNGGDQKVEATVSEQGKDNYYRVYLSWVKKEGWQVTRLEELKSID